MPLVAIPFLHDASVVMRGSRRERVERFRDSTTLELPEVDAHALEPLIEPTTDASLSALSQHVVLGGRILRPIATLDSGVLNRAVSVQEYAGRTYLAAAPDDWPTLQGSAVRRLGWSGRDEEEARIHRLAGEALVCEGRFYVPCLEPLLRAEVSHNLLRPFFRLEAARPNGPDRLRVVLPDRPGDRHLVHLSEARYFRLDEAARAIAWVSQALPVANPAGADWDEEADRNWATHLRVRRPDVLRHEDRDETLRVLRAGLSTLHFMLDRDAAGAAEWLGLRDWLNNGGPERDGVLRGCGAMASLVERARATIPGAPFAMLLWRVTADAGLDWHPGSAGYSLADPQFLRRSSERLGPRGKTRHADGGAWGVRLTADRVIIRPAPVSSTSDDLLFPPLPDDHIDAVAGEISHAAGRRLPPTRTGPSPTPAAGGGTEDWIARQTAGTIVRRLADGSKYLPTPVGLARAELHRARLRGSTAQVVEALVSLAEVLNEPASRRPIPLDGSPSPSDLAAHETRLEELRLLIDAWRRVAAQPALQDAPAGPDLPVLRI